MEALEISPSHLKAHSAADYHHGTYTKFRSFPSDSDMSTRSSIWFRTISINSRPAAVYQLHFSTWGAPVVRRLAASPFYLSNVRFNSPPTRTLFVSSIQTNPARSTHFRLAGRIFLMCSSTRSGLLLLFLSVSAFATDCVVNGARSSAFPGAGTHQVCVMLPSQCGSVLSVNGI